MTTHDFSSVLFVGSLTNNEFLYRYQIQESFHNNATFYTCNGIEESVTFLRKVPIDWVFISIIDMEREELLAVHQLLPYLKANNTLLIGEYEKFENVLGDYFEKKCFISPSLCSPEFVGKLITHKEEYSRLFEDFEEHKEVVKKVSEVKNLFLSNISHEVRTPLNSILGFSELLEQIFREDEEIDREDCLKQILLIHQNAQQLHEILHQVIEISREESNYSFIQNNSILLDALIKDVTTPYRSRCIDLKYQGNENPERIVCYSDANRIRSALDALLNNACKFSENQEIEIEVSFLAKKEEGDQTSSVLQILVRDYGIGIEQDDLELIFNQFYQVDRNPTRKYSGLGLGLSLVKKIIKELKGEVTVSSQFGEGSTFTLQIPVSYEIIADPQPVKDFIVKEPITNASVLIVENDFASRETLHFQLKFLELENSSSHSAEEGCKLFEEQFYPIILMDIQMPKIDGFEATKKILKMATDKGYPQPKIIAITADAREELREKCLSSGFSDIIVKPITLDALANALKKYINIPERSAPNR